MSCSGDIYVYFSYLAEMQNLEKQFYSLVRRGREVSWFSVVYYNRGVAYGDKGNYDQAISDCTRAIELDPNYADAYYNRGVAYGDKGNYDQTISDCTRAIELNLNYADAY